MVVADKELKIRKAIWKELKRLIEVGTTIEYLETGPEIFYSTQEMSLTLEKILVLTGTNKERLIGGEEL